MGASAKHLDVHTSMDPYKDYKTPNANDPRTKEDREHEERAQRLLAHVGAAGKHLDVKTSMDPYKDYKTPNAITLSPSEREK